MIFRVWDSSYGESQATSIEADDAEEAAATWADRQLESGDCDTPEWLDGSTVLAREPDSEQPAREFAITIGWSPDVYVNERTKP